jgi:hypothetical protein
LAFNDILKTPPETLNKQLSFLAAYGIKLNLEMFAMPVAKKVCGKTVAYTRNKTDVSVTLKVHKELQAALAATPRTNVVTITTAHGRSFTLDGFSTFMRRAIAQAGLQSLADHTAQERR